MKELTCPHCGRVFKKPSACKKHVPRCTKNPDRVGGARRGATGRRVVVVPIAFARQMDDLAGWYGGRAAFAVHAWRTYLTRMRSTRSMKGLSLAPGPAATVLFTLPPDLGDIVDRIVQRTGHTFSQLTRHAIEYALSVKGPRWWVGHLDRLDEEDARAPKVVTWEPGFQ